MSQASKVVFAKAGVSNIDSFNRFALKLEGSRLLAVVLNGEALYPPISNVE